MNCYSNNILIFLFLDKWKCKFDELRCQSSGQCIPILWKCDGKGDCRNNEDEFGCRG